MLMEIRNSKEYYRSVIHIFDMASHTLSHAALITLIHLKKYELCVIVSTAYCRLLNYKYEAHGIECHAVF